MKQNICVIGEGAWGTAVATVLAANGHTVTLWCHDKDVAADIERFHTNNRYLPHIALQNTIRTTTDLRGVISSTQYIFLSTPVAYLRAVLKNAQAVCSSEQTWVMLNKGIERDTNMVPSQIVADVLVADVKKVIVSGPSFARDVANQQTTGMMVAAHDKTQAQAVQKLIENSFIKTFYSPDVLGVQYAAALKNVLALGMGILHGLGTSENTKAFFLTAGLHEIAQVVKAAGGLQETVYGLSGVGDLVLTATGTQSRNAAFGYRVGKGESLAAIATPGTILPEGVNTVASINHLAQKYALELPLCHAVYQVVVNGEQAASITEALMGL